MKLEKVSEGKIKLEVPSSAFLSVTAAKAIKEQSLQGFCSARKPRSLKGLGTFQLC